MCIFLWLSLFPEQTRSLFEYKCKQPFIPTKQFGEALSMFKQTGSVIISGKPGEGKTFTAYKLIESLGLTGMLSSPKSKQNDNQFK